MLTSEKTLEYLEALSEQNQATDFGQTVIDSVDGGWLEARHILSYAAEHLKFFVEQHQQEIENAKGGE